MPPQDQTAGSHLQHAALVDDMPWLQHQAQAGELWRFLGTLLLLLIHRPGNISIVCPDRRPVRGANPLGGRNGYVPMPSLHGASKLVRTSS